MANTTGRKQNVVSYYNVLNVKNGLQLSSSDSLNTFVEWEPVNLTPLSGLSVLTNIQGVQNTYSQFGDNVTLNVNAVMVKSGADTNIQIGGLPVVPDGVVGNTYGTPGICYQNVIGDIATAINCNIQVVQNGTGTGQLNITPTAALVNNGVYYISFTLDYKAASN